MYKNKKLIGFLNSLILLPITTMSSVPLGPIAQGALNVVSSPQLVFSQKLEKDPEAEIRVAKAEAIDAYFKSKDMPLAGYGMTMVLEAEKNELDWRLVPAIAVRESTGGKHECKKVPNNPFGWGSCRIGFTSNEHAIETIAKNLGGNNPKTAHYYDEKTVKQILHAYNPPSIVPKYAEQVMKIMSTIGPEDITAVNQVEA